MTSTTATDIIVGTETGYWTRNRRFGVVLIAVGLLAVVFWGILAKSGATSTFNLGESVENPIVKIPIPARVGTIVLGLITAGCGAALFASLGGARAAKWLSGGAIVAIVLAFLC